MAAEEERILDLAGIIADGDEVDWKDLLARAKDPRQREVIENLQGVAQLVAVHKSLHPGFGSLNGAVSRDRNEASLGSPPVAPGSRWGHLELRARIGRGSFGEVYCAWDPRLEREVALKLVNPAHAQDPGCTQAIAEGRLMAKVRHAHVVSVFGADSHDGRAGIWMELVRGRTLARAVSEAGSLGPKEAALVGMDLCGALAAVHKAGLVHRDVKAENVIREEGGRIVLMDLGAGFDTTDRGLDEKSISGTPLYMAPEVLERRGVSPRSDLYSLGVLLYHLVTGRYPVEARTLAELREAHAKRRTHGLLDSRPDLPRAFVQVIDRALEPDPERRLQSAGEMENALAAFLGVAGTGRDGGEPRVHRPWWRTPVVLLAATALVAGGVIVAIVLARSNPHAPPANAALAAEYDVRASFHCNRGGDRTPLENGARVSLGDRVGLEIESSRPLWVYIVNEDESGHIFRLFPLPALATENPLAAGAAHELPGSLKGSGEPKFWGVNTIGGREHMLVVASPERLTDFEADLLDLDVPVTGESASAKKAERVRERLRGFGVLESQSDVIATKAESVGSARAPELVSRIARRLSGQAERVRGIWMRQFEFENPAR